MIDQKRAIAGGLLAVGAGALVFLLFSAGPDSAPSGWVKVNDALETAVAELASPEKQTTSPEPSLPSKTEARPAIAVEPIAGEAAASPQAATQEAPIAAGPKVPKSTSEAPIADESSADRKPDDSGLLNLNDASLSQLEDLPGIGASKAAAIEAYRDANRGFRSVEELMEVKGIGPKLYEKIAPLVAAR